MKRAAEINYHQQRLQELKNIWFNEGRDNARQFAKIYCDCFGGYPVAMMEEARKFPVTR